MMPNYALMTSAGKDRPGIVAAISGVLLDADCNIEDSQMSRLGPDFACMLMLAMPEGMTVELLAQKLEPVREEFGLWIRLADVPPEIVKCEPHGEPVYLIHVYGADRKGIVHRISGHLADHNVNVTNLHTEVIPHRQPLYVMLIEVEIPPSVDSGRLQDDLKKIGAEIGVRVSMKPKDDARF